jgi:hypothetical protein
VDGLFARIPRHHHHKLTQKPKQSSDTGPYIPIQYTNMHVSIQNAATLSPRRSLSTTNVKEFYLASCKDDEATSMSANEDQSSSSRLPSLVQENPSSPALRRHLLMVEFLQELADCDEDDSSSLGSATTSCSDDNWCDDEEEEDIQGTSNMDNNDDRRRLDDHCCNDSVRLLQRRRILATATKLAIAVAKNNDYDNDQTDSGFSVPAQQGNISDSCLPSKEYLSKQKRGPNMSTFESDKEIIVPLNRD